jgi:hypothetical protein
MGTKTTTSEQNEEMCAEIRKTQVKLEQNERMWAEMTKSEQNEAMHAETSQLRENENRGNRLHYQVLAFQLLAFSEHGNRLTKARGKFTPFTSTNELDDRINQRNLYCLFRKMANPITHQKVK